MIKMMKNNRHQQLKKEQQQHHQLTMKEKDDQQSIEQLLHDKIEKQLQAWTKGNKKDVVYQLGHNLLFSKDPVVRAEAWRELNRLIDYNEDTNSP
jgi:transcription initiation factor IIF auxiliary subunit